MKRRKSNSRFSSVESGSSRLSRRPSPPADPHRSPERPETESRPVTTWALILKEALRRFNEDHGFLTAAGLSYFTLISLIPMLLVGVGVLGFFMNASVAQSWVLGFIQNFMPSLSDSPQTQARLLNILSPSIVGISKGPKEIAAIVGLIGFIWAAGSVFLNMEVAFNDILDIEKKRSFLKSRLMALEMIVYGGILLIGSVGITSVSNIIQGWKISLPAFLAAGDLEPGKLSFMWKALSVSLPILFSFLLFVSLYLLTPSAGLRRKPAAIGAIFASVAFEIAKHAYGWYVGNFTHYNKIYGSVGWLVILVLWTLYSYAIVLLGAEIADAYGDRFPDQPILKTKR